MPTPHAARCSPTAGRPKRDLVASFPGTSRPGQVDVLRQLEAGWDKADVHVLQLPVAFGKTKIAQAIQQWCQSRGVKAHLAVPNNALAAQLRAEFPRMATLEARRAYTCTAFPPQTVPKDATCEVRHAAQGSHCANCPYVKSVRNVHGIPVSASNYHTMLAHKIYKPTLIVDEAHLLLPMIREMEAVRIWPHTLTDTALRAALERVESYDGLAKVLEAHKGVVQRVRALKELAEDLSLGGARWLVSNEDQLYHGQLRACLSLLPIDTQHSTKSGQLWPTKKTQKIVLMSATLSALDVEQLGLAGKRVAFYSGASPIPVERRPWAYLGHRVGSMGYATQGQNLGRLVDVLVELSLKHDGKGLIHAPYELAAKLVPALKARLLGKREVFGHGKRDKQAQFDAWQAYGGPAVPEDAARSPQGAVLVGSGMHEGINLHGPSYQWQAIAKMPFPSLAEPANKYLAETEPTRYAWETVKQLAQAFGRISRGPDDYGITYICDASFKRFYDSNQEQFPQWFREAEAPV